MTTAISWLALGVSILSLSWNVASWLRAGPRLAVRVALIAKIGGAETLGYGVIVTNMGRQEVSVQEICLSFPRSVKDGYPTSGRREVRDRFASSGDVVPARLATGDEIVAIWPYKDFAEVKDFRRIDHYLARGHVRSGLRWVSGGPVGEKRFMDNDKVLTSRSWQSPKRIVFRRGPAK